MTYRLDIRMSRPRSEYVFPFNPKVYTFHVFHVSYVFPFAPVQTLFAYVNERNTLRTLSEPARHRCHVRVHGIPYPLTICC